jgi:Rieske Fe-S protein
VNRPGVAVVFSSNATTRRTLVIEHQISRRTALKAGAVGAAGVGAVSLAACGASGGGGTNSARNANDLGNAGGADNAGSSVNVEGAPGGQAGGGGAASRGSAKTAQKLASLDAIKVGEAVAAKLPDGSPVLVARPSSTTAACFSAICTHMGCTVNPDGTQLRCPCHGSVYDAVTGKVVHGPAPRALSPVPVKVVDGEVVTG